MAESVGLAAAAAQFAELLYKAARFARDVHAATDAAPMARNITQLETFAAVAEKVAELRFEDDRITERILQQYTPSVKTLVDQLAGLRIGASDGRRGRIKKAVRSLWEKDEIEMLFAQLQRDQLALLMHRSFASHEQFVQKITSNFSQTLDDRLKYMSPDGQAEQRFLDAIFVTDPRDDRSALIAKKGRHVEGTCTWVTQTEQYRSWFSANSQSPGLILEGGPGKGKSMMAIFLTKQLEQLAQRSDTESVLYFFCDNSNARQNNALAILRSLCWQLCRLRPRLLHHGTKELKDRGHNGRHLFDPHTPSTAVETIWRIFYSMLLDDRAGIISCVIDGLDECDEDSVTCILDKLYTFAAASEGGRNRHSFKFIILSRPLSPRQRLPQLSVTLPKVRLDPDKNKEVHRDIDVFIERQVELLAKSSPDNQWSAELRKQVESALQNKAGGTFLWVGFVAQDLRSKTVMEIKGCLKTVPIGLKGIYDRILKNIPIKHRPAVRWILRWVCLSERPLRINELAGLIDHEDQHEPSDAASESGVDFDSESESGSDDEMALDQASSEDVFSRLQDILRYCNHFVVIVEETVRFVHQSAKDYLMRTTHASDPDMGYFRMGKRRILHERLGRQCMRVLLERIYLTQTHVYVVDSTKHPELNYAARFWVRHLHYGGDDSYYPDTNARVLQLIRRDTSSRWLWGYLDSNWSHARLDLDCVICDDTSPALAMAVALGLCPTVRELLRLMTTEDYASAVQVESRGPLRIAIEADHRHIVKTLLNAFGATAVSLEPDCLAMVVGNAFTETKEMLQLLLAVQPCARAVHGDALDRALGQAAYIDDDEAIKLLVQAGADVDTAKDHCGRSLFNAFISGRIELKNFDGPRSFDLLLSLNAVDVMGAQTNGRGSLKGAISNWLDNFSNQEQM